jgi:hypothetical protein
MFLYEYVRCIELAMNERAGKTDKDIDYMVVSGCDWVQ